MASSIFNIVVIKKHTHTMPLNTPKKIALSGLKSIADGTVHCYMAVKTY